MKKRSLIMLLAALLAVGMTACGGEEVPTQEVEYDMTFENQTGKDISKLEIRYADNADWSEISLTDGIWKNSYQMPVSMAGQMPVAEDGWQVQMTFTDEETDIWEGVKFADETTITFSLEEGDETVLVSEPAEEAVYDETEAFESDSFEQQEDLLVDTEE